MQFLVPQQPPATDWIYDIETYPNIFTCAIIHAATGERKLFEVSVRRNDMADFSSFCHWLADNNQRMVGFNNVGFDYPIIHMMLESGGAATATDAYNKCQQIINARDDQRFAHIIWPSDRKIEQIDLYKIHHYDNKARSVGLKMVEVNMGMNDVSDLPYPPGTMLDSAQMDELIAYNFHDCEATLRFYLTSLPAINTRVELAKKFDIEMLNSNDTKIGKDYFINRLEQALPGSCYDYSSGKRRLRQTKRDHINLRDVILPSVQFENHEFQRIHHWLLNQTITETKGVFKDLKCTVHDLEYAFGTGGLHASVENKALHSDHGHVIIDVDVASYYPNLAIANNLYPAHLSESFCQIYMDVYNERKGYTKKQPENGLFKLALNGVYGDSNNEYSPFYDPAYTMSITINGQLLLCMLVDQLIKMHGLSVIQVNTDGVTVRCPRQYIDHFNAVCKWWEQYTGLELEQVVYKSMFVRDVNSYLAVKEDDSIKRIGAYAYISQFQDPTTRELQYHQDHSMRVVAKAAEAALVYGEDIREFIYEHANMQDFLIATKVPRNHQLVRLGIDGKDHPLPNIVRYVASMDGDPLFKIMPASGPEGAYKKANGVTQQYYDLIMQQTGGEWDERVCTKNKSKYDARRNAVMAGTGVTICNNMSQLNNVKINYEFYVRKAKKLVEPLLKGQ